MKPRHKDMLMDLWGWGNCSEVNIFAMKMWRQDFVCPETYVKYKIMDSLYFWVLGDRDRLPRERGLPRLAIGPWGILVSFPQWIQEREMKVNFLDFLCAHIYTHTQTHTHIQIHTNTYTLHTHRWKLKRKETVKVLQVDVH